MSEKNRTIHLICNAHLDPVWLWEWEEGAAEAMSTFRTAAEICEENDCFVFNHNEVILYKWVQDYDPDLFKRIQRLVKTGKWHIMGGWFLQPDCNMPSGESFVRQILLGKTYFRKYFGVEPTTAINFDPFGHTRGLVQILAKSGYDSYLFGRPNPECLKLPGDDFLWIGYDGSQVMATRFRRGYLSPLGKAAEKITEMIKDSANDKTLAVLWGVGNHGGGPSKVDVRNVNKLISRAKNCNISHSTPEAYFRQLRHDKTTLPKHKKDINPWAVGCYTSMIRVKQKHRQLENDIYMLEKMASAAAVYRLMKYPYEQLHDALCDLMMSQFHDILPGSSIQPVEEGALRLLGHGLEIISRLKAKTFFALAAGQHRAKNATIPIMVYNPHPFKVKAIIECEFNLPDFNVSGSFTQVQVYHKSKAIASQVEQELSNLDIDWRKRVIFAGKLEPSQMNRFDCRLEVIEKKPAPVLKAKKDKIIFKTKELQVVINTRTGLVDRYKVDGRNCLGTKSFEPIVIADNEDPWGAMVTSFRKVIGRFRLMSKKAGTEFSAIKSGTVNSVRIIEDGPARSVVEAVFAYGKSFICQRYKLPKSGTEIELEIRVHWNEKNKMLKLAIPIKGTDCRYIGQVAYGVGELPCDGNESVAHKWVAVVSKKDDIGLTCINDGVYGSDLFKNCLRLTLLRSPAYSALPHGKDNHTGIPQDRWSPRIDQGERLFHFWFNAGKIRERFERIDREALVKNERPFALSFYPPGMGKKPKPLAVLSDDVVQITAIERAEKNNDLIIRLFEPTGKRRTTVLTLPFIGKKFKLTLAGFEIRTLRINLKTAKITWTDLLERPVHIINCKQLLQDEGTQQSSIPDACFENRPPI